MQPASTHCGRSTAEAQQLPGREGRTIPAVAARTHARTQSLTGNKTPHIGGVQPRGSSALNHPSTPAAVGARKDQHARIITYHKAAPNHDENK